MSSESIKGKASGTLSSTLFKKCKSLLNYALKEGKTVEDVDISLLDGRSDEYKGSVNDLIGVYNSLLDIVKPATPRVVFYLEKNERAPALLRILGPLPIIRYFSLITFVSLMAMAGSSLSSEVNNETVQQSILVGQGLTQAKVLFFLMSCASVGSSFNSLFRLNNYLSKGTLDINMSYTYWSRYVLGIVSGILLSELLVDSLMDPLAVGGGLNVGQAGTPTDDTTAEPLGELGGINVMLKPILAILGGFSVDLVYQILNRMVDTVGNLFQGDMEDSVEQKAAKIKLEHNEKLDKIKRASAQELLKLKEKLAQEGTPTETLDQLDEMVNNTLSRK